MIIDDSEVLIEMGGQRFHCAMDVTMHFIGGKWKTVVLWYLRQDKKRFSELKAVMPQITEKMLSIQLKQLEEDGLINRTVYTSKPPLKVEYALTNFGKSLIPLLNEIAKWGRNTGNEKGKMVMVK
jgi:DNA-binding HxlR family transcriptional regulator